MFLYDPSGGSRISRILKNISWVIMACIFIQFGYIFYLAGWPLYINNVSFGDVATQTIDQMFAITGAAKKIAGNSHVYSSSNLSNSSLALYLPDGIKTFNTFWGTQMTVEAGPTQNTFILVIPRMPASVCKDVDSRINHEFYVNMTPCNNFTPLDVTYKYIGN